MGNVCVGCREDIALPFEFKMAFQPIVDVANHRVWGYEALVRGVNGESAYSILSQVTDEVRYRFDQAARVMAIETAGKLFRDRICAFPSTSCRTPSMSRPPVFRSRSRRPSAPGSRTGT